MKTVVQCQCGSAFSAPASLVGQVVKCPVCGSAMTVSDPNRPAQPQGGAARGSAPGSPGPGMNDSRSGTRAGSVAGRSAAGGTALGNSALGGSALGGSAMGSRTGSSLGGMTAADDMRRDLCPRCKAVATHGGRLCTTCLYEMHTGQRAAASGRFRFTLGLGIAAGILVTAGTIGGLILWNTDPGTPTVTTSTVHAPSIPSPPPAATNTGGGNDAPTADRATTTRLTSTAARQQNADESVLWQAPATGAAFSGDLLRARIDSAWDPTTGRQSFEARVVPRAGVALATGTTVRLFRGVDADGPFTLVDAAMPHAVDSIGALNIHVFDDQAASVGRNRVYYRLSGEGVSGERLFDTPAAAFPVVPPARVENGRLRWSPAGTDDEPPAVQGAVVIDAPGWEDVLVERFDAAGPIDQPLPAAEGLPLKAVMRLTTPGHVELVSAGAAHWATEHGTYTLHSAGGGTVRGVVPHWTGQTVGHRFLPPDGQLVEYAASPTPANGATAGRVLFRTAEDGPVQTLELPDVPAPGPIEVTPFDSAVRIAWRADRLAEQASAFASPVAVAVYRQSEGGSRQRIATVPLSQGAYDDTSAVNGMPYRYSVALTSAGNPDVPPLIRAGAFVVGHGRIPVLLPVEPDAAVPHAVIPNPQLSTLNVSLAHAELAYAHTCDAAIAVMQAVRDDLRERPGVRIIERGALVRTRAGGVAAERRELPGLPAQLQLRVLDASSAEGLSVELWAIDTAGGEAQRLFAAPVDAVDPGAFVAALRPLLHRRQAPAGAQVARNTPPAQVVFARLDPLDQPEPYAGAADLAADLAQRVARRGHVRPIALAARPVPGADPLSTPGTVLVTGRAWSGNDGPSVLLQAIDAATGEHLGSFRADRIDDDAEARLAAWCAGLRIASTLDAAATFATRSPLLESEARLKWLHPVWQSLASQPQATAANSAGLPPLPGSRTVTFNVGLPVPAAIAGFAPAQRRPADDPLAPVRPFVGATNPPGFDHWIAGYAAYIANDYRAFVRGIEQLSAASRGGGGNITPALIIRGERRPFTGTLTTAIPPLRDAVALNVRGVLPAGPRNEPLIDYGRELRQTFAQRPYAAHHAWRNVSRELADPFLRGVLLGVHNGTYGRPDMNFTLPPDLPQFLAAVALADNGNTQAAAFRRRAVEVATSTYGELQQRGMIDLDPRQSRYVTNTLLILAYENDPTALAALRDPQVLTRYIQPPPGVAADTLRLLLDRVGPVAWDWAAERRDIDWHAFLWRSPDEMQHVASRLAHALPDDLRQHLHAMFDHRPDAYADAPDAGPSQPEADAALHLASPRATNPRP
jgi:hypothetical protein